MADADEKGKEEKDFASGGSLTSADKKRQRQESAEARKRLSPLTKESKKLESEIEKLQAQLSAVEVILADVEIYTDDKKPELKEQLEIQARVKKSMAEKEQAWFDIQHQIETLG